MNGTELEIMTLNPIDGSAAADAAAAGFNKIRSKKGKKKTTEKSFMPEEIYGTKMQIFSYLPSLGFIFLPCFLSLVGIIFIEKWQIGTLPRTRLPRD